MEGKNDEVSKNRVIIVPKPAKTEISRPAIRGEKNFRLRAVIHINKGCLPSV